MPRRKTAGNVVDELIACGPPDEWSGGIADVLGPGRRRLRLAWARLSRAKQREVRRLFRRHFDS